MIPSSASERITQRGLDLPARLRHETADLHRTVEIQMGLPSAVHSRADYVRVLTRLLAIHTAIDIRLDAPVWREEWRKVGLELVDHRRTYLLREDLSNLGMTSTPRALPAPELVTFGQALGGLYVVEGSALGGRVLAPAIQTILGRVPTAFLDGETRGHPHPWHQLMMGLGRFEEAQGNCDQVILGARITYRMFGTDLARSTWSTAD